MNNDIKVLIDGSVDEKLAVIEKNARQQLLMILGPLVETVPEELEFIVTEVSILRFNRISNEGMTSYSNDGINMTFESTPDFDAYMSFIDKWKEDNKISPTSEWTVEVF